MEFLERKKKKFFTMSNNHIAIIVASYKDKNLFDFVKALTENTVTEHSIEVYEQHPVDHSKEFSSIDRCAYDHEIWDDIAGLPIKKADKIARRLDNTTHICILSPDSIVSYGWDLELLSLIDGKDVVISGNGKAVVKNKDLFSLSLSYLPFSESVKTQFVTKNFIFARSGAFCDMRLPDFLKYSGEDEYWTLQFMSRGFDIYSTTESVYRDTGYRSIENTYHTFSAEHNYNIVVDILNKIGIEEHNISSKAIDDFFLFHGIEQGSINKLPYQTNDVEYNPYNLEMHDVDARRFIAGTKAVY